MFTKLQVVLTCFAGFSKQSATSAARGSA